MSSSSSTSWDADEFELHTKQILKIENANKITVESLRSTHVTIPQNPEKGVWRLAVNQQPCRTQLTKQKCHKQQRTKKKQDIGNRCEWKEGWWPFTSDRCELDSSDFTSVMKLIEQWPTFMQTYVEAKNNSKTPSKVIEELDKNQQIYQQDLLQLPWATYLYDLNPLTLISSEWMTTTDHDLRLFIDSMLDTNTLSYVRMQRYRTYLETNKQTRALVQNWSKSQWFEAIHAMAIEEQIAYSQYHTFTGEIGMLTFYQCIKMKEAQREYHPLESYETATWIVKGRRLDGQSMSIAERILRLRATIQEPQGYIGNFNNIMQILLDWYADHATPLINQELQYILAPSSTSSSHRSSSSKGTTPPLLTSLALAWFSLQGVQAFSSSSPLPDTNTNKALAIQTSGKEPVIYNPQQIQNDNDIQVYSKLTTALQSLPSNTLQVNNRPMQYFVAQGLRYKPDLNTKINQNVLGQISDKDLMISVHNELTNQNIPETLWPSIDMIQQAIEFNAKEKQIMEHLYDTNDWNSAVLIVEQSTEQLMTPYITNLKDQNLIYDFQVISSIQELIMPKINDHTITSKEDLEKYMKQHPDELISQHLKQYITMAKGTPHGFVENVKSYILSWFLNEPYISSATKSALSKESVELLSTMKEKYTSDAIQTRISVKASEWATTIWENLTTIEKLKANVMNNWEAFFKSHVRYFLQRKIREPIVDAVENVTKQEVTTSLSVATTDISSAWFVSSLAAYDTGYATSSLIDYMIDAGVNKLYESNWVNVMFFASWVWQIIILYWYFSGPALTILTTGIAIKLRRSLSCCMKPPQSVPTTQDELIQSLASSISSLSSSSSSSSTIPITNPPAETGTWDYLD